MSTDPARHSRGRVFDCIHHSPSPRDASSTTSSTTHDAAFSADSGAPQERERVTQSALSELGASIRRRGVPYGLSARARARLADVADGEGTGVTRAEAIPVQDVHRQAVESGLSVGEMVNLRMTSRLSFLAGMLLRAGSEPEDLRQDILSCLLYTSPSPRDRTRSRMPSSA